MSASKKKMAIKYTSRDSNSIKQDLIDYAKRYYSDVFRDFNEASFGSLLLDMVSYIGDNLSFYLDYSVNESFLDSSIEYNNIIRHGKMLGYKFKGNPSSSGEVVLYVVVPAKSYGLGPDTSYIPKLLKGSTFSTNNGISFILIEDIDFKKSSNEVVVARVDDTTSIPTHYAIKASGKVISGEMNVQTITVGDYSPFLRVELGGENISEVISVIDSEGHVYYEVDFLSQDVIYRDIPNKNSDREYVKNILKPFVVPRRFVVEQEEKKTSLQFGYGSQEEIKLSSIADPTTIVLQKHGKNYYTDTTFDPSKLIETDKFGVVPSNTTLTITTRNNSNDNVNAFVGSVNTVNQALWWFDNEVILNSNSVYDVKGSLEVTNENPIIGDVIEPSSEELRRRVYDVFASQNRAVTKQDYLATIYSMPPSYGAIKRASIAQDNDSFKRNLNCYVVSEDATGVLVTTNRTIKENLKVWLNKNRMINDTIDILDAKVITVGIEFEALSIDENNRYQALSEGIELLKDYYSRKLDIGENFNITNIYTVLKLAPSIADVTKVKIVNKRGGAYSDTYYNVDAYTSIDGREIFAEEDVIFEIRFPNTDIRGTIK